MSPRWAVVPFLLPLAAPAQKPAPNALDPELLIRRVVKSQRLAEERMSSYTYDQREVRTKHGKDGLPKEVERRLFYVFSGANGEEGTRELAQVDGRPATDEEKRDAAAEDAKGRKKRLEKRAAEKASDVPGSTGVKAGDDEDDPVVGTRRLSDLLKRFEYRVVAETAVEGRPVYVLEFSPHTGLKAKTLGDSALNSLAGRVVIDAADFQIRSVEAHIVSPVKVAGGLAANIKEAVITYDAEPVGRQRWFPCLVELRLKGKTALLFRLDTTYRFEMANFKVFNVDTESAISDASGK